MAWGDRPMPFKEATARRASAIARSLKNGCVPTTAGRAKRKPDRAQPKTKGPTLKEM